MRTQPIPDEAACGLGRRDAGRWGVPLAALVAVFLSVGVSAALVVSRIDDGTAAAGGGWLTVAAAHAATSSAASLPGAGR